MNRNIGGTCAIYNKHAEQILGYRAMIIMVPNYVLNNIYEAQG